MIRNTLNMPIPRAVFYLLAILLLLIVTQFSAVAGIDRSYPSPKEVEYTRLRLPWTSTNSNPAELSRQMSQLYLTLFNAGNLPVRKYRIESNKTISEIAFEQGFLRGSHFPVELDALLCDLNSHVCSREKVVASESELTDPRKNIAEYKPTQGVWSNKYGDTITIVDLEINTFVELVPRTLRDGESPSTVLAQEKPDCSHFNLDCQAVVEILNPRYGDLSEISRGDRGATLPVTQVVINIPVRDDETAFRLADFYSFSVLEDSDDTRRDFEFADAKDYAPVRPRPPILFDDFERRVRQIEAMDTNLYKKNDSQLRFDSSFENLQVSTKNLLELTRHPFRNQPDNITDVVSESMTIGVIDTAADIEHCHFQGNVELHPAEIPAAIPRSLPCYEEVPVASGLQNHGTHVAGIITGGNENTKHVGLYPNAKISFLKINKDTLGNVDVHRELQTQIHIAALTKAIGVINTSWDYPMFGNDPVYKVIVALRETTLFVAAAGNTLAKLKRDEPGCTWAPACLGARPNVISVVGLTADVDDPDIWILSQLNKQGSNSGTAFDIAATAEGVVSSINGNKVAPLSGTSQAAPQVSAAAGLIIARFKETNPVGFGEHKLTPDRIKNRLMYTADVYPKLLTKVYSGRLNIERALDINRQQIVFADQPNTMLSGKIITRPPQVQCNTGGDTEVIDWKSIKRIARNELNNSMIIWFEEDDRIDNIKYKKLYRITDCDLETLTHKIKIRDQASGSEVERQFADVADYTARL